MFDYAQLNENNRVVAISSLSGEVKNSNMINISELDTKPRLGDIYDSLTGEFKTLENSEDKEQQGSKTTLEDIQAQTLLNTEYLVSMLEIN